MSRTSTWLFWVMAGAGYLTLAPCLILPAWIDYQAALGQREAVRQRIDEYEFRIRAAQVQIDHLKHDPAYIDRLAQRELGIDPPGVTSVAVETAALPDDGMHPSANGESGGTRELFPRLSQILTTALRLYPGWMKLFLMDQTRPVMLGLGGALLASAILLLGRTKPHDVRSQAPV